MAVKSPGTHTGLPGDVVEARGRAVPGEGVFSSIKNKVAIALSVCARLTGSGFWTFGSH